MRSSTVWHGHSTQPSLPAGTARKDSGHLSGARPLHLLSQTVLPLKSPTGAFIAALRFANASLPWQAEQAHHAASKEKQSVPDCWVSVKQFSRNDTATACQDWLRSTRLDRGSIKSHVRTVKVLAWDFLHIRVLYTSIKV